MVFVFGDCELDLMRGELRRYSTRNGRWTFEKVPDAER